MESPKYLIVITLVEGQNFSLPDCVLDKTATATVFAEARFENEPLRSDPVKLVNSNPEFLTELAWQVDRRSLHHFKVERRAIKLQVFIQTKPLKKNVSNSSSSSHSTKLASERSQPYSSTTSGSSECGSPTANVNEDSQCFSSSSQTTNHIQLVGYTIIDIRTAQERTQPKLEWRPLLNPKFKQPSYNRPEIQLALSFVRCDEVNSKPEESITEHPLNQSIDSYMTADGDTLNIVYGQTNRVGHSKDSTPNSTQLSSDRETVLEQKSIESSEPKDDDSNFNISDQSLDENLFQTCLERTLNFQSGFAAATSSSRNDGGREKNIYDNDINVRYIEGCHYIYDSLNKEKSTIDDCNFMYYIDMTIAFTSNLENIVSIDVREKHPNDLYHFSFSAFGTTVRGSNFKLNEANLEVKRVSFRIATTDIKVLRTYFRLNPTVDVKLHDNKEQVMGFASVEVDQLCDSADNDEANESDEQITTSGRSFEGIYALMRPVDLENQDQAEDYDPCATMGVCIGIFKGESDGKSSTVNQSTSLIPDIDRLLEEASNEISSWKDQQLSSLRQEMFQKEEEYLTDILRQLEAKEAKRDADMRRKMDDLNRLERKLKSALISIETKEKQLDVREKQMSQRDQQLSNRLEMLDTEISKAIESVKDITSSRVPSTRSEFSSANSGDCSNTNGKTNGQNRRSSTSSCGIPRPTRSMSLARPMYEANGKVISRAPKNVAAEPIGTTKGFSINPRPNSLNLGRETQEKLTRLRKERAELLKKGCRPDDSIIIEINSLIEKLARAP